MEDVIDQVLALFEPTPITAHVIPHSKYVENGSNCKALLDSCKLIKLAEYPNINIAIPKESIEEYRYKLFRADKS